MPERRRGAGHARIADENVQLAMTFMQRSSEPGNAIIVDQIKRHQGGAAAVLSDFVVELFKSALRSRHRHDMRAGLCERARGGIADAARGTGNEGDAGGEGWGHKGLYQQSSPPSAQLRTGRGDPYAVTVMMGKGVCV